MIKIRLHGLEEELNKLVEDMKQKYDVLQVSEPYPDRGTSKLVRIYLTISSHI